MPRPLLRKTFMTAAIAALLALLVVLALPYAASTRLVRDRIAQELGAWSGMRVELRARPEIEVWPSLRAVLHDVRFSDWERGSHPVLETDRIEMDMSALAALRGDVVFDTLRMVRPTLRVEPAGDGLYLPIAPRVGRITRAVRTAKEALAAKPAAPDLSGLPDDEFGTIEFVDARIVTSRRDRDQEIATGITGALDWPALNRGASLHAQGVWRGEPLSLDLASSQPLVHLAGGGGNLSAALRSQSLNAAFEGIAGLSLDALVDGSLQISSSSISTAARWLQVELNPAISPETLEFSGRFNGSSKRLKFDNASLIIDGHTGIGGFELAYENDIPDISGTLAFDLLDLTTLYGALSPLLPQIGESAEPGSHLVDRLKLDLRLSASTARAGPVTLGEVAATAQIRPGLAVLDISDARFFGGSLQAGLRSTRAETGGDIVELRFSASDFDGTAAGDALNQQALLPTSRGTVSLNLKGNGSNWHDILENADGNFSAGFARGTLRRFNIDQFLSRLQTAGFFPLSDVTGGTLDMEGVQVKAVIEKGVARINPAVIGMNDKRVELSGIIPYATGLALTGNVLPNPPPSVSGSNGAPVAAPDQPAGPNPIASFFVGGSWNAPFISSMTMRTPLE